MVSLDYIQQQRKIVEERKAREAADYAESVTKRPAAPTATEKPQSVKNTQMAALLALGWLSKLGKTPIVGKYLSPFSPKQDAALETLNDKMTFSKDLAPFESSYNQLKGAVSFVPDAISAMRAGQPIQPDSRSSKAFAKADEIRENTLSDYDKTPFAKSGIGSQFNPRQLAGIAYSLQESLPSMAIGGSLGATAAGKAAASAALTGIKAMGAKGNELSARGVDADEALVRGLLQGGKEGALSYLPTRKLFGNLGGDGGVLSNTLIQTGAGVLQGQASLLSDYGLDRAFDDPNANISWQGAGQRAFNDAISSGVMGLGTSIIGKMERNTAEREAAIQAEIKRMMKNIAPEPETAPEGLQASEAPAPEQVVDATAREVTDVKYTTLKNEMRDKLETIGGIAPVAQLTGQEFPEGDGKVTEQVGAFYETIGGKVHRAGFGDVILDEKSVRDSMHHGFSGPKIAAFASVPDVIKHGLQVNHQENWENRGYDTYTFAAPVLVGDNEYYVGAIVNKKADGRFYVHEIIGTDGRNIRSGEIERNRLMQAALSPVTAQAEESVASKQIIPQPEGIVNEPSERLLTGKSPDPSAMTQAEADAMLRRGERQLDAWLSNDSYDDSVSKYDAIPQGEEPRARDIQVPSKITDDQPVSYSARTLMEAGVTPDSLIESFQQAIKDGEFSYEVITDAAAKAYANNKTLDINGNVKPWDALLADWRDIVRSGKANKNDIAYGQTLYNAAAQAGATDTTAAATALNIAIDLADIGSKSGQNLQAQRMLKQLTPDSQLYYIAKQTQRLNKEFANRRNFHDIELDPELVGDLLSSTTPVETEAAVDALRQNIANQMPVSNIERIDAWRNMAMLGNPKTHIRNFIGNETMFAMRKTRDFIGAAMEEIAETFNWLDQSERTKSITKTPEAVAFAREQWDLVKDEMTGGKYFDSDMADIKAMRNILNTAGDDPVLQALEDFRKFNDKALEASDTLAKGQNYKDMFAQAMSARGLTADFLKSEAGAEQLQGLHKYAKSETMKATFNDDSQLARDLRNIGESNAALKMAMDAIMPFKRTPINIVKRGVEYSPLGVAVDSVKLTQGKMTGTEYIQSISQGLTGTMAMGLGYALAKNGVITPGRPDNVKESRFWKLEGKQPYALNVGGHSYTVNWAVPSVMPVIGGIELYEIMKRRGLNFASGVDSLTRLVDPIVEQSFMQGVDNLIKSAAYGPSNFISNAAPDVIGGYASQFIPTMIGQASRTFDPIERNTSWANPENNWLTAGTQRTMNRLIEKTPLRTSLMPSINQWGEVNQNTNPLPVRAVENFLSPGFARQYSSDRTNQEIRRLFDVTGEKSVIPNYAPAFVTVDGKQTRFNQQQFQDYSRNLGQTKKTLNDKLFNTAFYKSLPDADKVSAIKYVNDYANAIAKQKVLGVEPKGWIAKAENVARSGVSVEQQVATRAAAKDAGTDEAKVKAIAAGLKISQERAQKMYDIAEKYKFSVDELTENQRARVKLANTRYGISERDYLRMMNAVMGIEADKTATGRTINYSKERKQREAIIALGYSAERANQFIQSLK